MPYDPAINSRNASTGAPEEAYKSLAPLFIVAPKQKLPKCSSAEWKNKLVSSPDGMLCLLAVRVDDLSIQQYK